MAGRPHTYDGNGNLTDDGVQTYIYDYRNQLVEVKTSGGTSIATYRFDAFGRRVEKNVVGTGVERHVLSGLEIIETCDGVSTWKQRFAYGQGIDQVVMLEQADVLDYDGDSNTTEVIRNHYHRNVLGSIMYISEPDGTEGATYRYNPYGAWTITRGGTTQGIDPLGQDVGYTGRWWDEECNLWHYRARSYSADLGRFVQRDPDGLDVGPNLYEYARCSPAVFVDPDGRHPIVIFVPAGVAKAAATAVTLLRCSKWRAERACSIALQEHCARSHGPSPLRKYCPKLKPGSLIRQAKIRA